MSTNEKTLSQNLAVKSLMGEFNAANGYGLIGTGAEQTANIEQIDPNTGKKKEDKDLELMLFLDEMQRLDQESRELIDKLYNLQNEMNGILDDMEADSTEAKGQETDIKAQIKASADKDVDKMTEFMLASGLFDEAEIEAMKENGSFAKAYEEFVDDNISALSSTLDKISGHSIKYNETRNAIEDTMHQLTDKRDLAQAAGNTALVEEIDQSLEERQNLLDANDIKYKGIMRDIVSPDNVLELKRALEEHSIANRNDATFSSLTWEAVNEVKREQALQDTPQIVADSSNTTIQNNPNLGEGLDF